LEFLGCPWTKKSEESCRFIEEYVENENCFRIDGSLTLFFLKGEYVSIESLATQDVLDQIRAGMNAHKYRNASLGLMQAHYLGPSLFSSEDISLIRAENISIQSSRLTAVGISIISLTLFMITLFAAMVVRRKFSTIVWKSTGDKYGTLLDDFDSAKMDTRDVKSSNSLALKVMDANNGNPSPCPPTHDGTNKKDLNNHLETSFVVNDDWSDFNDKQISLSSSTSTSSLEPVDLKADITFTPQCSSPCGKEFIEDRNNRTICFEEKVDDTLVL